MELGIFILKMKTSVSNTLKFWLVESFDWYVRSFNFLHWGFSSWSLKILDQNSRRSTKRISKYLWPYHTMDGNLSLIPSSVIGAKSSIARYQLNIFINDDSCRSQAASADAIKKASNIDKWHSCLTYSCRQVGCPIVARRKKWFFQRGAQDNQEDSGPLESSS